MTPDAINVTLRRSCPHHVRPRIASTTANGAMWYRKLPELLRSLREEAGLKQRGLGERLGKPQSWVHNCETANRRVDVAEFCRWCEACGIDPVKAFRRFLRH